MLSTKRSAGVVKVDGAKECGPVDGERGIGGIGDGSETTTEGGCECDGVIVDCWGHDGIDVEGALGVEVEWSCK